MYFVPVNVSARFEILPGFGLKELLLCGMAAGIGGGLALLAGAFALSPTARFALAAIPPGAAFIAGQPAGSCGESLLDLVRHYRNWLVGQKLYLNSYEGGE
jgi:hypothetical protein